MRHQYNSKSRVTLWLFRIMFSIILAPTLPDAAERGEGSVPLDAGVARNCNIDAQGILRSWGDDVRPFSGAAVEGRFIAVSVAVDRTCAIRTDGLAGCWLPVEPSVFHALPFGPVIAIDATSHDVCAVRSDGQLPSMGSELSMHAPNQGRHAAISLALDRACALRTDGRLDCWGKDGSRLSGNFTDARYLSVSMSDTHVCAVRVHG